MLKVPIIYFLIALCIVLTIASGEAFIVFMFWLDERKRKRKRKRKSL